MRTLLHDLRYAVRQLRKTPGMAVLAILTLALGVGANTAIFTVIESVLLRPLPYAHSDRLVYIGAYTDKPEYSTTSWLNYRDVQAQSTLLEQVAGYSEDVSVLQTQDASQALASPRVTANLFSMLGVQPALGRTFTDAEGQAGGPQVALLSDEVWRQSFHADPVIVGQAVKIGGQSSTVVGVMPRGFHFPEELGPDMDKGVWLPLQPTAEMLKDRGYNFFNVVGELRPGVSVAQAQHELDAIAAHIPREKDHGATTFRGTSYQELLTGPVRPVFYALFAALGLVLLIACANVSNLLIARCLGRQQEFAVRAALGAGRTRLVRQMLAEGLALSVLGCGVGLLLAQLAMVGVRKLPAGTIPRADSIAIHWNIVLVLASIAVLTTILSSLLPALLVARANPQAALQAASRGVGSRSVGGKLSGGLVAIEVALSTLLLVGTGLLFHTLWNLEQSRLGFETANITTFTAYPADSSGFSAMSVSEDTANAPPSVAALTYQPVLDRIRQVPGVYCAALSSAPPLSGMNVGSDFAIVGQPKDLANPADARVAAVSGEYARTLGTPIIRGRMISDDDVASAPFVTVINEDHGTEVFRGQRSVRKADRPRRQRNWHAQAVHHCWSSGRSGRQERGRRRAAVHYAVAAADPHHLALLSGTIENHGRLRGQNPGQYSRRFGDEVGVSSGRPATGLGQLPNHAGCCGAKHVQPAARTVPRGIVRRACDCDGDRRPVRSAFAIGWIPETRDRSAHGAGRDPAERFADGLTAGIHPDWNRARRGTRTGLCLRTADPELPLSRQSVGCLDICLGAAGPAGDRTDCGAAARA